MQALIHLEIFLPQPKQIDYLDSLVYNFILTSSDSVNTASAAEREELSCIFLDVVNVSFIHFEIYLLIEEFNQILAYSYLIVNSYMTLCWHEEFFLSIHIGTTMLDVQKICYSIEEGVKNCFVVLWCVSRRHK
jgi:hypothetical protein